MKSRESFVRSLDTRNSEFASGYRCAWKDAITMLSRMAAKMDDPKARSVLNDACFTLGCYSRLQKAQLPMPESYDLHNR
jgi:spore coat protein CotF